MLYDRTIDKGRQPSDDVLFTADETDEADRIKEGGLIRMSGF